MAHFAELDETNIVKQVIVVHNNELLDENGNESEQKGIDFCVNLLGGNWVRTSFNTHAGVHETGGTPLRKNFATPGSIYDPVRNAFYMPSEYPSWVLNEDTCIMEPPIPYPSDDNYYLWNEEERGWVLYSD
jgi:hypothetical protein